MNWALMRRWVWRDWPKGAVFERDAWVKEVVSGFAGLVELVVEAEVESCPLRGRRRPHRTTNAWIREWGPPTAHDAADPQLWDPADLHAPDPLQAVIDREAEEEKP